jgi:flagellar basal body-associated protein FliL
MTRIISIIIILMLVAALLLALLPRAVFIFFSSTELEKSGKNSNG